MVPQRETVVSKTPYSYKFYRNEKIVWKLSYIVLFILHSRVSFLYIYSQSV